jgi:DNA-binding NtrC family response regulator
VRELRNVLDRALYMAAISDDPHLALLDLPVMANARSGPSWEFDDALSYRETRASFESELERRYVGWLLDRHAGNISAAARAAKMDRKHLTDLARKHGLRER